jgi:hypothetical protein
MNSSFNKVRTADNWSATEDATAFAPGNADTQHLDSLNTYPLPAEPGEYLPESENEQAIEDFKSFISARLAKHKAPAHLLEQIKHKIAHL